MKKISILGSTGSIGKSALNLIELHPEWFEVVAIAAGSNVESLLEQGRKFSPQMVAVQDESAVPALEAQLPGIRVVGGTDGVVEAASHPDADIVLSAITGAAGLIPTFQAVVSGKDVALANKEALVMAGELLNPLIRDKGARLLPVDSEHSALHQCLSGSKKEEVRRLWLTASGGPFREKNLAELEGVTRDEALAHPTWEMGPKITIDSATLMNKGLEVIEAHHLFGVGRDQISVVIHPQSIVHSMVEFVDGNFLAQMSVTDMRSAILYALSYPDRREARLPRLDVTSLQALEFTAPDLERFPCLQLAYQALEGGQTYPTALNAANEVAVELFLEEQIGFCAIPNLIDSVLQAHRPKPAKELEEILEADRWARATARNFLKRPGLTDV